MPHNGVIMAATFSTGLPDRQKYLKLYEIIEKLLRLASFWYSRGIQNIISPSWRPDGFRRSLRRGMVFDPAFERIYHVTPYVVGFSSTDFVTECYDHVTDFGSFSNWIKSVDKNPTTMVSRDNFKLSSNALLEQKSYPGAEIGENHQAFMMGK